MSAQLYDELAISLAKKPYRKLERTDQIKIQLLAKRLSGEPLSPETLTPLPAPVAAEPASKPPAPLTVNAVLVRRPQSKHRPFHLFAFLTVFVIGLMLGFGLGLPNRKETNSVNSTTTCAAPATVAPSIHRHKTVSRTGQARQAWTRAKETR